jgi:hypothetical protein
VITLSSPIQLPPHNEEYSSNINEYPIKMEIELMAMVDKIDFDIMVIYNEHS